MSHYDYMFPEVVRHMERVEASLQTLDASRAMAFALSCTERQFPVLKRATEAVSTLNSLAADMRTTIDCLWMQVPFSAKQNELLEDLTRYNAATLNEFSTGSHVVLVEILQSIQDLASASTANDSLYAHHLSGRNIGMLEVLSDEWEDACGAEHPILPAIVSLLRVEMAHQWDDILRSSRRQSANLTSSVRVHANDTVLFGELWFPENKGVRSIY